MLRCCSALGSCIFTLGLVLVSVILDVVLSVVLCVVLCVVLNVVSRTRTLNKMIFRHNINFLYIWNIYIFALLVSQPINWNHQKILSMNFKGPSQVNSDVYFWLCTWIGCTSYSVGFQMHANVYKRMVHKFKFNFCCHSPYWSSGDIPTVQYQKVAYTYTMSTDNSLLIEFIDMKTVYCIQFDIK